MTSYIAAWSVLARIIAITAGIWTAVVSTTEGRRDKRRGTNARYVVVVVPFFARRAALQSPAPGLIALILRGFYRAAAVLDGHVA